MALVARAVALATVAAATALILDRFLTLGRGWPGAASILSGNAFLLGWIQFLLYPGLVLATFAYIGRTKTAPLLRDTERLSNFSAFVIRAAFWAVCIIGVTDMAISFLRIEEIMQVLVGEKWTTQLGVPQWRGNYVHMPLMVLAIAIALRFRGMSFIWLAALVVTAELLIVLARFIFSYEQAFMGDLVRFWYAALFLFASATTLLENGHVRVDVLYTNFSERGKARVNLWGAVLLGAPICWTILILGLRNKSAIIAGPILAYEITQSGFGLYVKYMMAGFLGVFAYSMLIQFASSFLGAAAFLQGERSPDTET